MANKSPRNRLQKLFHRHADSDSKQDSPSPPSSPNPSDTQRHARSTSGSLRDAIGNRVPHRASSKSRQRVASAEQSASSRGQGVPTQSLDDAPPLPNLPAHRDFTGSNSTRVAESAGAHGRTAHGIVPERPRRSDEMYTNDATSEPMIYGQALGDPSLARKPLAGTTSLEHRSRPTGGISGIAPGIHAASPPAERPIARKSDVDDLRRTSIDARVASAPQAKLNVRPNAKDLNPNSSFRMDADATDYGLIARYQEQEEATAVESALGRQRGYLIKDSPVPVDLTDVVDLTNSEDTTVYERWAPAVTHETVTETVHEIRKEVITREIHNHHYFHRVLPIIDIEVLPARHFVPMQGGYAEISEDEVPARGGKNAQWMIMETVSKMLPKSTGPTMPRRFTARQFHGADGQYKEYVTPEGIKRTETTWIYPPTIEMGGQRSGQTVPFYFGCSNPADNGLRAHLPGGQVLGVSPLLAKQQRERLTAQQVN